MTTVITDSIAVVQEGSPRGSYFGVVMVRCRGRRLFLVPYNSEFISARPADTPAAANTSIPQIVPRYGERPMRNEALVPRMRPSMHRRDSGVPSAAAAVEGK